MQDAHHPAEADAKDALSLQKKLRWQCRRGMLEMDFMLRRYLDHTFAAASPARQTAFIALLRLEDDLLWDLLLGSKTSDCPETTGLLNDIRGGYSA
jgi:antitoxin CptB